MEKKNIINAHKNRKLLSEEKRRDLDNQLFDAAQDPYQHDLYQKLQKLLEAGADPNFYKEGKTPVYLLACASTNCLKLLVAYGGDLSLLTQQTDTLTEYNRLPLHDTCTFGALDNTQFILETLQEQGKLEKCFAVQTEPYKYTPRICASQGTHRQEIHALLDKFGVPHNIPDDKMRTELCWSAGFGDEETVTYLKQTGAKAITYDQNGKAHKASIISQCDGSTRKILKAMEEKEQADSMQK